MGPGSPPPALCRLTCRARTLRAALPRCVRVPPLGCRTVATPPSDAFPGAAPGPWAARDRGGVSAGASPHFPATPRLGRDPSASSFAVGRSLETCVSATHEVVFFLLSLRTLCPSDLCPGTRGLRRFPRVGTCKRRLLVPGARSPQPRSRASVPRLRVGLPPASGRASAAVDRPQGCGSGDSGPSPRDPVSGFFLRCKENVYGFRSAGPSRMLFTYSFHVL